MNETLKQDIKNTKGLLDIIIPSFEIPECIITNGHNCWMLEVDKMKISFQGRDVAIYFALHYSSLGYKVCFENHCKYDPILTSEEIEKHLEKKIK